MENNGRDIVDYDTMRTRIIRLHEENWILEDVKAAADVIRSGGLVAFPTETVYGLGGNALDATVVEKIYLAKGRPSDNPLILHISKWEEVKPLVNHIPEDAKKLADEFWPGPLTIILPKSRDVPKEVTGGLDTVAIRMPNHKVALALIRLSGVPIAAPSANVSGRPSPTMAKHVIEDLSGRIDMILDCGSLRIGIESTIVDLTSKVPAILRPGFITTKGIRDVIGKVQVDTSSDVAKAPGMKYRHYAPKGEMIILEGNKEEVVREINQRAKEKPFQEVGIISTEESKNYYKYGNVYSVGSGNDEESIARKLYQILREMDEKGVKYIYTESFHSEGLGNAIMNRLLKAAGNQVILVKPSIGNDNNHRSL